MSTQAEVVVADEAVRRTRKRRSALEKLRIVRETLESGASVAVIARRHGINANQVFSWRRQFRSGALKARGSRKRPALILPVEVAEPRVAASVNREDPPARRSEPRTEQIEVEFPSGLRLRIRGGTQADTLRDLIRELARQC